MTMAGLKPVYIDKQFPQKFVITKSPTNSDRLHLFNYYGIHTENNFPLHRMIAPAFKIDFEYVLGGGYAEIRGDTIALYGTSEDLGSVPYKFLDFFKEQIVWFHQKDRRFLGRISIEVPEKSQNDRRVLFLDEILNSYKNERPEFTEEYCGLEID